MVPTAKVVLRTQCTKDAKRVHFVRIHVKLFNIARDDFAHDSAVPTTSRKGKSVSQPGGGGVKVVIHDLGYVRVDGQ